MSVKESETGWSDCGSQTSVPSPALCVPNQTKPGDTARNTGTQNPWQQRLLSTRGFMADSGGGRDPKV